MKGKLEGVQMISNPYYNFKFNYSAQGIQVSNPSFSGQYGQGQNRTMRKFFEQSVYTGGDHSNYPSNQRFPISLLKTIKQSSFLSFF